MKPADKVIDKYAGKLPVVEYTSTLVIAIDNMRNNDELPIGDAVIKCTVKRASKYNVGGKGWVIGARGVWWAIVDTPSSALAKALRFNFVPVRG